MEKSKYLRKFNYDPSTFDSVRDKLVTWDDRKVKVVHVLNTYRLLVVISDGDYEKVSQYTFDGKEVIPSVPAGSSDIYIDDSTELWVNLFLGQDGRVHISDSYLTKEDALKNISDIHFDTVSFKTVIPLGIPIPPIGDMKGL